MTLKEPKGQTDSQTDALSDKIRRGIGAKTYNHLLGEKFLANMRSRRQSTQLTQRSGASKWILLQDIVRGNTR